MTGGLEILKSVMCNTSESIERYQSIRGHEACQF
jgi:hypothetical protein